MSAFSVFSKKKKWIGRIQKELETTLEIRTSNPTSHFVDKKQRRGDSVFPTVTAGKLTPEDAVCDLALFIVPEPCQMHIK